MDKNERDSQMDKNEMLADAVKREKIAAKLDEQSKDLVGAKRHRLTAEWLQELLESRKEFEKVHELAIDKAADNCSSTERLVLDRLGEAWSEFLKLERQHPDELGEFRHGIHRLQGLVAMRVARRYEPESWPTHKQEKDSESVCKNCEKGGH